MSEQALTEAALLERIALGEHTRQQFKRTFSSPDAMAAELGDSFTATVTYDAADLYGHEPEYEPDYNE